MSKLKIALPAVILLGGFLACTTASFGTTEYMKQTKKSCAYCHAVKGAPTKENAKELTDAGKYFAKKKTLDGYTEPKK